MQTVPVFVVPPVQREAGGGVATNVVEVGAIIVVIFTTGDGVLAITMDALVLSASAELPPLPIPPLSGGTSGLRFATIDGGGLGGRRKNMSMVAFGLKRRT